MKRIAWNPLIDGLLESVWLVDPVDLCILTVNQAACDLIGLSKEMMVGKPVVELTATPEDQFFWEDVAAGLIDSIHSETLLRGSDGLAVAVERRVSKVWAEADRAVYLVGIHDLRHQRRAENELERLVAELRATLESTADGILVSDLEGNIRNYNRHFSELWNVPEAIDLLVKAGIQHLLTDLPSVDREEDGGQLLAHKTFWNYPAEINRKNTITEMIYVPNAVVDGQYLAQIQIPSFQLDAAPSRIFLYKPK